MSDICVVPDNVEVARRLADVERRMFEELSQAFAPDYTVGTAQVALAFGHYAWVWDIPGDQIALFVHGEQELVVARLSINPFTGWLATPLTVSSICTAIRQGKRCGGVTFWPAKALAEIADIQIYTAGLLKRRVY